MAVIKNVRQIFPPAAGGQVEVVYDEGDCKYIFPHETDAYAEVQSWVDAGNTVVAYVEPTFDSDGKLTCLLYTSPSPRDKRQSRMPSSA